MPPCPISPPPPAVVVAWPWQAPLFWLIYLTMLGLLVWAGIANYRYYRNGPPPSAPTFPCHTRRSLALTLFSLALLAISLTLMLISATSYWWSEDWYHLQFARFSNQNCDINPIFSILSRLHTPVEVLSSISLIMLFAELAAFFASLQARGMLILRPLARGR